MKEVIIISAFLSLVLCYTEYNVESDRICTPLARKRKLRLGFDERSGLIVKETRYFDGWSGSFEFNCNFELEALAKDGIVAVIQKLDLRRNETTKECIDYVQFLPEQGTPSTKKCGTLSTLQNGVGNTFVDYKGELNVVIHVAKQPLKHGQKLDIEMVFSAYKLCAKNPSDYLQCNPDLCIWKGLFNDNIINCPFDDCKDEKSCDVRESKGNTKEVSHSSPWYYAVMIIGACLVFLVLCLYLVFNKRRSPDVHRYLEQPSPTDCQQHLSPSAPSLPESPKDKPPAYDELFPNH